MRDADPIKINSLEGDEGEVCLVRGDVGVRLRALLADPGDFSRCLVLHGFGIALDERECCYEGKTVRSRAAAGVELGSEVEPHGDECVEDGPVAVDPGSDDGENRIEASVARATAEDFEGAPSSIQRPQAGRKRSRLELERAIRPQRNPKRSQRDGLTSSMAGLIRRCYACEARGRKQMKRASW